MTVSVSDKNARMEVEFPPDWRVLRDLRSFVKKLVVSVALVKFKLGTQEPVE